MSQKSEKESILKFIKSSYIVFCGKMTRGLSRFLNFIESLYTMFCDKMFQYFYATDVY